MTAEIVQFIPKPNPNRKSREELLAEELNKDTAPCEMPPVQPMYVAPERDPA